MVRSTSDSTRFTATGVWAHTKPGKVRSTILDFADPAPKNETPQQKVKRLREAANRAKLAQITKWDWAYFYGRMAADMIHKGTVYGIIFATGCLSVLAVFSIGDMIVYNRRKRALFFEQQEKEQAEILALAREAVLHGTATPAQEALVKGIAEEEAAMAEKVAQRKFGSKILWWLHGDWKEDKKLAEERKVTAEILKHEKAATQQDLGITEAVQEARSKASAQPIQPIQGGPLDQAAATAATSVQQNSKGWLGWMWGSKKSE